MHGRRFSLLASLALALFLLAPMSSRAASAADGRSDGEVMESTPGGRAGLDAVVGAPVPEGPAPRPPEPDWHDSALGRVFFAIGVLVFLASVVRIAVRRGT